MSLRIFLIGLASMGFCGIYDQNERIKAPLKEYENRMAMGAMTFLRRSATHLALMAIPLFGFEFTSNMLSVTGWPGLNIIALWPYGLLVLLALYALTVVLRLLLISFFFARISLRQMLGFNLLAGLFGTLFVTLPELWKLLPGILLFWLVLHAVIYVARQNPEGDRYLPKFFLAAIRRDKKQRLQIQDLNAPSPLAQPSDSDAPPNLSEKSQA
jgi:hypothetical protein